MCSQVLHSVDTKKQNKNAKIEEFTLAFFFHLTVIEGIAELKLLEDRTNLTTESILTFIPAYLATGSSNNNLLAQVHVQIYGAVAGKTNEPSNRKCLNKKVMFWVFVCFM